MKNRYPHHNNPPPTSPPPPFPPYLVIEPDEAGVAGDKPERAADPCVDVRGEVLVRRAGHHALSLQHEEQVVEAAGRTTENETLGGGRKKEGRFGMTEACESMLRS